MREVGISPNEIAYNAAISACDHGGQWEMAVSLLDELRTRADLRPTAVSYSSAISACGRAGEWQRALGLFDECAARVRVDNSLYNVTMQALVGAGRRREGFELLRKQQEAIDELGVGAYVARAHITHACPSPSPTCMLLIHRREPHAAVCIPLSACICARFRSVPACRYVAHYTLLQACRAADDLRGAETVQAAIERHGLRNLSPQACVVVDGARTRHEIGRPASGLQARVDDLVERLRGSGGAAHIPSLASHIAPLPYLPSSRVSNPSLTSPFHPTSQFCPASPSVPSLAGYQPRLDAVPFDRALRRTIEEQEAQLRSHPEKLALADLLARQEERGSQYGRRDSRGSSGACAPEPRLPKDAHTAVAVLRQQLSRHGPLLAVPSSPASTFNPRCPSTLIGKISLEVEVNFKMCADCHAYFRAASKLLGQPITVREPRAPHVFENGSCSCSASWPMPTRRVSVGWGGSQGSGKGGGRGGSGDGGGGGSGSGNKDLGGIEANATESVCTDTTVRQGDAAGMTAAGQDGDAIDEIVELDVSAIAHSEIDAAAEAAFAALATTVTMVVEEKAVIVTDGRNDDDEDVNDSDSDEDSRHAWRRAKRLRRSNFTARDSRNI